MYYEIVVAQFTKTLQNLNLILDKAAAHADQGKYEVEVLLNSRLAPDQFPLLRQLQIACDTAKNGAARLVGRDAPVFADDEKSLAEVKARIDKTIAYLATLKPKDFEGAGERRITQPRWAGKTLSGEQFTLQHMLPNFFFHVTTAYAVLRSNGVAVGKRDYLGSMPYQEA